MDLDIKKYAGELVRQAEIRLSQKPSRFEQIRKGIIAEWASEIILISKGDVTNKDRILDSGKHRKRTKEEEEEDRQISINQIQRLDDAIEITKKELLEGTTNLDINTIHSLAIQFAKRDKLHRRKVLTMLIENNKDIDHFDAKEIYEKSSLDILAKKIYGSNYTDSQMDELRLSDEFYEVAQMSYILLKTYSVRVKINQNDLLVLSRRSAVGIVDYILEKLILTKAFKERYDFL